MSTDRVREDVVIIGGGPGGSAAAMNLVREGIQPLILEAEEFPRYHIGESMTGAAAGAMRALGLADEMYRRGYPNKQGVNVYGQSKEGRFWVPVTTRDEDWKIHPADTWQIRRSDFDDMMLKEAQKRGAKVRKAKVTAPIMGEDGAVLGLKAALPDGNQLEVRSEMVLDCSGQATFLANAGVTGPKYLGNYDKQIAIFSQVKNTIRDNGGTRETHKDNTFIFYWKKFHWAWFIPLDDETVSVGIVTPSSYFLEKKESLADYYHRELHELHPELARRVPDRTRVEDVHVIPNYSYQVRRFTGKGFACIGDAHRFIDPIFSFGLTVTMREGAFIAPKIREYLAGGPRRDWQNPFADHQLFVEQGIDCLEDSIDLFWEQPLAFAFCVHHRHIEPMTDLFAGRIFEHQPSVPVKEFRKLLGRTREREYETPDEYSIPIGSRYHPERAPIWDTNAVVKTTEKWLGDR